MIFDRSPIWFQPNLTDLRVYSVLQKVPKVPRVAVVRQDLRLSVALAKPNFLKRNVLSVLSEKGTVWSWASACPWHFNSWSICQVRGKGELYNSGPGQSCGSESCSYPGSAFLTQMYSMTVAEYSVIYFYVPIIFPLEGRGKFLKVCREKKRKGSSKKWMTVSVASWEKAGFWVALSSPSLLKRSGIPVFASVRLNSILGEISFLDHL